MKQVKAPKRVSNKALFTTHGNSYIGFMLRCECGNWTDDPNAKFCSECGGQFSNYTTAKPQ